MPKLNVTVHTEKCQAYGACMKNAPDAFKPGDDGKVELHDVNDAPDDVVLKAARSCPYKAITVVDAETGQQIHPRVRT